MPTYTELLPATKSSPRNGIRWTPSQTERGGHLLIDTKRRRSEYLVAEFPAYGGRAFRFAKVAGVSDTASSSEDVFLSDRGPYATCSCRGFAAAGHCKHLEAVKAILENGWTTDQLAEEKARVEAANAEADALAEFAAGAMEAAGSDVPF